MSASVSASERVPTTFLADPAAVVHKLRSDWEVFHEQRTVGRHIRPVIATSWDRSLELGVSPDRQAADVDRETLEGFDGRVQIRRLFGVSADPVTGELADELAGSNSAIVVCDDHGVIVDRRGDPAILRRTDRQNFVQGASWSEQSAGTNGIGLALALGRPAQVFSAEHFCVGFQDYACTAAPVRHPVTREVIGVLDVTTKCEELTYHTYAMVVHAARDIERQLEEHVLGGERELLERYLRGRVGLQMPFITVDRSGRTIIQNALAAERLSASDDLPAVLQIVRQALTESSDLSREVELSVGRSSVRAHLVRAEDEVIGAVVAVEPVRTRRPPQEPLGWQPLQGTSSTLRLLLARAERTAIACLPAVIEGEPGTGKRTLAEAMHARSPRRDEPLAVVNFAARSWRPEWEAALRSAGTIVLRRLTALSETQQLELAETVESMRTQERSPWLISIMTAGDRPLRLELLHRLGSSRLVIPPLRERTADIESIVLGWAIREAADRPDSRPLRVSDEALIALRGHDWPGNVRELLNTLAAAAALQASRHVIRPDDLTLAGPAARSHQVQSYGAVDLRNIERDAIEQALAQTGGNISRAAELLGISRSTLHRRLQTYRLIGC